MNLPLFIARRLMSGRKGTFSSVFIKVAILATALSMATMILADAFVQGFQKNLKAKIFGFMGHVHITPYTADASNLISAAAMQKDEQLRARLGEMPDVAQVSPFIIRPAILRAGGEMHGVKLKGMEESYRFAEAIQFAGNKIDYTDTAYSKEIILSQKTAALLSLKTGDPLFLYFIEQGSIFPRIRKLTVCGLYQTGMEEIDKGLALCDIRLLQRINNWRNAEISGYQIDLHDPKNIKPTQAFIHQNLLNESLMAVGITEVFPNIFSWLDMLNNNVLIIFIVMGAVAAVNIISALLLFSIDRIAMSGILKAIGISDRQLQFIHLYHAIIIAVAGILLGNVLALGIAYLQDKTHFITLNRETYGMDYAAVSLNAGHLFLLNAATVVLCFLTLWLPSFLLRRIQIVKAISFK